MPRRSHPEDPPGPTAAMPVGQRLAHESTAALLIRAQGGDESARETLAGRYWQALRRWAHGRLPRAARDLVDTDDLVQSALYRAMTRIADFEHRGDGAFLAYLRQILLNQIRDEARRVRRRPEHGELPEHLGDHGPSPLESLIGRETLARYERGLAGLAPTQREAVFLRVELGLRYRQIAEDLGLPSGNAARLLVARGLVRLAREMRDEPA